MAGLSPYALLYLITGCCSLVDLLGCGGPGSLSSSDLNGFSSLSDSDEVSSPPLLPSLDFSLEGIEPPPLEWDEEDFSLSEDSSSFGQSSSLTSSSSDSSSELESSVSIDLKLFLVSDSELSSSDGKLSCNSLGVSSEELLS